MVHPLAPLILGNKKPPCSAIFTKIGTSTSLITTNKQQYQRIILTIHKIIPPDEEIPVENCNGT